ncbi:polysaccharide deacetylase family protein [Neobacillus sp. M.A.Huq-85]
MSRFIGMFFRKFYSLKNNYYAWRYWSNLYRNMKNHIPREKTKKINNMPQCLDRHGIAFSFDDSYRIYDWYKYGKELFEDNNIKVTFNINAFHHFERKREHTQNEIDMLLELQSKGHEIAHHSFSHKKATEYSNEFGMNCWIENEIESLNQWMKNQRHSKTLEGFKRAVTFAFPHFLFNEQNIKELVPKYFKIVRGHLHNDNLISSNHSGFAPSICLDGYYSVNLFYLKKIMKLAKKTGRNLILTCHSILPKEINWEDFGWGEESKKSGTWRTSPETLQAIIDHARRMGFAFYTTSEIAGVATFIDPNFEKYVKGLISDSTANWILISDLYAIKELDLSNKVISNLAGIQYFVNLEKLTLDGSNLTNFSLLDQLSKLKEVKYNSNLNVNII